MQNPAASSDEVSKIVELTLQNRTKEAEEAQEAISRRDLEEFITVMRNDVKYFRDVGDRNFRRARRLAILACIIAGTSWPLCLAVYLSEVENISPDPVLFSVLTFVCGAIGGFIANCGTKEKKPTRSQ